MSGEGDGGRYGSITEEADSRDGAQDMAERAWYDQPVRRQNPYFLVFSLVLFSSLLVVGIALNAVGVVTFGPGQYKTEILESIRLCEVDFCGGGVLLGEDGLPIDNEARGSWRNPLDEYQIESCSKERDAAAISEGLSLNLIAQFDNPTNAPVKVEAFHLEVARSSSGEKLVECKPLEVPATVNPAGLNRLDVTCDVTRDQIASLVASYWNGHKSDLAATWSATVTSNVGGQELGRRARTFAADGVCAPAETRRRRQRGGVRRRRERRRRVGEASERRSRPEGRGARATRRDGAERSSASDAPPSRGDEAHGSVHRRGGFVWLGRPLPE